MSASKAAIPGVATGTASMPWGVFLVSSIAVFLVSMDGTLLYAAFGAVRAGFPGSTAADLSWVLNAYTVVYAALLVPAGRLVDAHGRRRVFLAGLGLFLAASAGCGPGTFGLHAGRRACRAGGRRRTLDAFVAGAGAGRVSGRETGRGGQPLGGGRRPCGGPRPEPWIGGRRSAGLGAGPFFINLPLGGLAWWQGRNRLTEWRGSAQAPPLDAVGIGVADGIGGSGGPSASSRWKPWGGTRRWCKLPSSAAS